MNFLIKLSLIITISSLIIACARKSSDFSLQSTTKTAPLAVAANDFSADTNNAVTLDGSASSDSDGTIVTYYVAPLGDDANNGSIELPFKSVEKALTVVAPGDIIYLRGGTHELSSTNEIGLQIQGVDGEPGNPIKLWAYPGERPVFVPADPLRTRVGIRLSASYWHIRGIEVTGVEQRLDDDGVSTFVIGFHALKTTGSIFEEIESHHNGGVGFYLGGNSTENLVLNSDFHHNSDPLTTKNAGVYGNSDGMHIRVEHAGTRNHIKGVRVWNNSDDGIDTWYTAGLLIIEDTWSFWNGYEEGMSIELADGNGFKLGPYINHGAAPDLTTPLRIVTRSMAFQNRQRGFDWNNGKMFMHIFNNSSFGNGKTGIKFKEVGVPVKLRNNASLNNGIDVGLDAAADDTHNTWNAGFSVSSADFISVDPTWMNGARQADGSLPDTDFLKLVPGSALIDAGADVGYHYTGSKPDIGGRESGN